MAFQNYVPPLLTNEQAGGLPDIIGSILGGYSDMTKARYLQPTLQEQLQKAQLENKWYGPNIQSQIGLRGAQAGHLGAMTEGLNITNPFLKQKLIDEQAKRQFELENPFFGQTGISGDLGRLLHLQKMIKDHPELAGLTQAQEQPQGSPSSFDGNSYLPPIQSPAPSQNGFNMDALIKDAFTKIIHGKDKQFAPSNILKLQNELKDIESGRYPGTNEMIPTEQMREELAAPYREKLGALKQGEHYVYDPKTHEKIGVQRPYTENEKKVEQGRTFFNEVFPKVNNGFKDFIGKGSIDNFIKYANDYGKNPIATKKIDDLLLAEKLISATVVNEAATLGAGKTNMTYRNLLKSFPNSDLPGLIEQYKKQLSLPPQAFFKAGIRFNDVVNSATDKAAVSLPAMKTVYYHPEKHQPQKSEKSEKSEKISHHYTDADIKATAEKYGISEKEVKERLKKAKKNG